MIQTKYIHYGSSSFDISRFNLIADRVPSFVKPDGGLWASPVDPPNIGWKEWCEDNDFHIDRLKESFIFSLKPNANVLKIHSGKDLEKLRWVKSSDWHDAYYFEPLVEAGYDAMEVFIGDMDVYWNLYGWDVDSLLLFNPNVIVPC